MPDINKYKSVAVPITTWERLKELSKTTHRSPAQQIAFLVELADDLPSDVELLRSVYKKHAS
jgi:hypothetical protein|tara:strand:+ start:1170 stop:1355 length:186 start_codon:yes stop_codon:yes gene_type:complete